MSLASLPDVLIVHLCNYLDYDDVCNLMETSKKNYNAIKAYKKDKMKADVLRYNDSLDEIGHEPVINSKDGPAKSFFCEAYYDSFLHLDDIENVFKECFSVGRVEFYGYHFSSDLSKVLLKTKAKIGKVFFERGAVDLDVKEFVIFCQKFKGSEFNAIRFYFPSNSWTDDVLINLIEALTEIRMFQFENPNTVHLITDRTLKTLLQGNSYPKYFDISAFHNSFTIQELVNSLKILKDRNCKGLNYKLGYLQSDQLIDAEHYFNENTGELRNEYSIGTRNHGRYNVYRVSFGLGISRNYNNEEEQVSCIWFYVLH